MKLKLLNTKNAAAGDVEFSINEEVRQDLIQRAVEAYMSRKRQPYGADPRAGLKHNTDVHRRRRHYRGSYGKGISRVPRKVLSRSGMQFYWVGAEAPGTVGGRRAHPPKANKNWVRKINKKENQKAIRSAVAATLSHDVVTARGHKVPQNYPFALANDFESLNKTKDVIAALHTLGFADELVRGEKGAKSLLIVTEHEQLTKAAKNIPGIDVCTAAELNAHILAPGAHPGRATLFTEASIKVFSGEAPKTAPVKKAAKSAKKATKSVKKPTKKAAKSATSGKKEAKK